jgi:hypothetical protein
VASWLEDAALFAAVGNSSPELRALPWWEWPEELRLRTEAAMAAVREERRADIDRFCAVQFLFDRQWRRLKAYANGRGVKLVGDMPIYVGGHSADVWVRRIADAAKRARSAACAACLRSRSHCAACAPHLTRAAAALRCARPTRGCGRWARTARRAR